MASSRWVAIVAAAFLASCVPVATAANLQACHDAAAATVPVRARNALARIDGSGRQLLALRGYLRARDLEARWSWDQARIAAYEGSPEQRQAHAQVERVQARFAADNPGYTLHVNLQVRSLEEQLRKWNANASVGVAAEALAVAAASACTGNGAGFADWLRRWRPATPVNLAVPGLSSHGQGRAYDFQVMRGGVRVAGTDSARRRTDWVEAGWAARLQAAVAASGAPFDGPLRTPDEPWHYAYRPAAAD